MGIKKAPLVFLVLHLFLSFASAEPARHWEPAGWDGGGCYPNIVFDPSVRGRLYLTSDVAGLWRSDDSGENWRFATRGLTHLNIPALAVSPADSNILYAASGGGLFISRDAGSNWALTSQKAKSFTFVRPESYRPLLISSTDPARVLVGTALGELWSSADFGKSWKSLGAPLKNEPITALVWSKDEKSFFAASKNGVARISPDSGRAEVFAAAPKPVSDLLLHPSGDMLYAAGQKELWRSADGGKTWSRNALALQGVFYRLAAHTGESGRLLTAWNHDWKGVTAVSTDGGSVWIELDDKMESDTVSNPTRVWASPTGRINALAIDPFDSLNVFRTDWWGVWRSRDGGATWKEKIKGAPNTVTSDVLLTKKGELYVAAMDNGLLKSADGGSTYETVFPKSGYRPDVNGHVWRVAENARGEVFATSSPWGHPRDQVVAVRADGQIERSESGLPAKRPEKDTIWNHGYAKALAVHPSEPDTLYLGIDGRDGGGFFVSNDGGRSWAKSAGQPGSSGVYNGLVVDARDPKRIFWGTHGKGGGVFLSEDGGKNWRRVFRRMRKVFDVALAADGRVYAAGDFGGPALFSSPDGVKDWKLVRRFGGKGAAEALCPLPDGRLALGVERWNSAAPGHVFLGSSDGKEWTNIDGDLPDGEGPSAMVYDAKTGTLYMARYAGSVYKTKLTS